MDRWRDSVAVRYGMALLCFGAAFFLKWGLGPFMTASTFLFFYAAVMVAGWWGGWGPALLTTLLSLVAVDYYFLPPALGWMAKPGDAISLGIFTLISGLVTWLNVSLRRTSAERAEALERERAARDEAERERARLHDLFMQAPAHIALFRGPQHVYELSNPLNTELLGHRELLGKPVREAVPVAQSEAIASLLDHVYTTGQSFVAREMPIRIPQADGSVKEVVFNLVYQPTHDIHGTVDGIAGFGFDVTDLALARQRAEALATELRQGEERLRMLAEASAVLSSSLDYEATLRNVARLTVPALADWCLVDMVMPDGTFQRLEVAHASPGDAALAEEVKRYGPREGGNPRHPPTEAFLQAHPVLIEDIQPEHFQQRAHDEAHIQVMRAVEPRSYVSVPLIARERALGVLSFITSHSGRHYTAGDLAFFQELANRAALSMENARLYREAQEAVRLRDEFLSIASHELKTPLTPLSLKLQALARELGRNEGPVPRALVEGYVEVGTRQVKKLAELVGDLLDVSRIAAGRLTLESGELDVAALVREVVARHEAQATRVGSSLQLEGADGPVLGWADRLRLEQVVMNLVDNAIKYGQGRPISLRLDTEPERVRLTVRDEGIGIATENLQRIFGRFERAVSDRHYGGLGLGLYITRTLLEAMGGSIQVESLPGQGSTFTVELPTRASVPPAP